MSRYRRWNIGIRFSIWLSRASLCTVIPVWSGSNNDIGHSLFLIDGLVVVVMLWKAGYDVPGV